MTARRWLLAWLLFALVCAQALGFMHRVVHGGGTWGPAEAHAGMVQEPAPAGDRGVAPWIEDLFAHDQAGLACHLFDGAGQCGVPPHLAPPVLPLAPALVTFFFFAGPPARERSSPFQARAPPVSR